MCHVCGRHDPRLAPLMLNARRERRACQRSRLGRWRALFWRVIHHRFHLTAAAVSLSLSKTTDPTEDTQALVKNLSGIGDEQTRGRKKALRYLYSRDILINTSHFMQGGSNILAAPLAFHKGQNVKAITKKRQTLRGVR